jgi:hypothetical protein
LRSAAHKASIHACRCSDASSAMWVSARTPASRTAVEASSSWSAAAVIRRRHSFASSSAALRSAISRRRCVKARLNGERSALPGLLAGNSGDNVTLSGRSVVSAIVGSETVLAVSECRAPNSAAVARPMASDHLSCPPARNWTPTSSSAVSIVPNTLPAYPAERLPSRKDSARLCPAAPLGWPIRSSGGRAVTVECVLCSGKPT